MADNSSVLTCWKDIATHLGKTVRTVQRWERELGMPVHRPNGPSAKVVCALPVELAQWISKMALDPDSLQPASIDGLRTFLVRLEALIAENAELAQRCAATQRDLEKSRRRLRIAAAEVAQQLAQWRPLPASAGSRAFGSASSRRSSRAAPSNGRARFRP